MIRVILNGLGGIGQKIAHNIIDKRYIEVIGATTARSEDLGKDLGEVLGIEKKLSIEVTSSLSDIVKEKKADVVVDATFSRVEDIKEFLFTSVEAGINFISVCEELAYPWAENPSLSQQIDELAKRYSVTVLGTGINPGFIGDLIPLVFTAPCRKVKNVTLIRTTNAGGLGPSALSPFAIGEQVEEFEKRLVDGTLRGFTGHKESIMEIADSLGQKILNMKRILESQVTKSNRNGNFFNIMAGKVCGVKQETIGFREDGEKSISLTLRVVFQPDEDAVKEDAELGLKVGDFLKIDGDPNLEVEIRGLSDAAAVTANHAANAIPYVLNARPGLLSPRDFPPFVPRH